MQLRQCSGEDFDNVLALLQQLWPAETLDRKRLRAVYERSLSSEAHANLCATEGPQLIGFGSLTLRNSLWQAGWLAHVDELVVDRNYRRQGIGTRLLQELLAVAQQRGCRRIELDSAFQRDEAHRFYEQQGFQRRAYLFSKVL